MKWFLLVVLTHFPSARTLVAPVHMCTSDQTAASGIYCYGRLLEAVAHWKHKDPATFGADSKDFVDRSLKQGAADIITSFDAQFSSAPSQMNKTTFKSFLDDNFNAPGGDLQRCILSDWSAKPQKVMAVKNTQCQQFAVGINHIWKMLCREMSASTIQHPERHSLLNIPHPFIAPGGRFREFYYWDTYWILKGLHVSGMTKTAEEMIRNLIHMVKTYGFVPNGGRVYYLARSQPPFLALMVYDMYVATGNLSFVKEVLPYVDDEFEYWHTNCSTLARKDDVTANVYRYVTKSNTPRPESYKEDVEVTQGMNADRAADLYTNIASVAMSGMDFSSRWASNVNDIMRTTQITRIAPVDLNALMHMNMKVLALLHKTVGNDDRTVKYSTLATTMEQTIETFFYHSENSTWYDFDLDTQTKTSSRFYASNLYPLWTDSYNTLNEQLSSRAVNYVKKLGVFNYENGVPTSLIKGTHQQWDFPNAWAPHNWIVIEALRKSNNAQTQELAFQLAQRYVNANYVSWRRFQEKDPNRTAIDGLPEKIDVTDGTPGGEGEYPNQLGFGWTNGAVLDLMYSYADRMECNFDESSGCRLTDGGVLIVLAVFLVILQRF